MELVLTKKYNVVGDAVPIGILSREDGVYKFKYLNNHKADLPERFYKVPGFDDPARIYESETLFWVFADRMTPRDRPDFKDRLAKLGMDCYDEWEYLRRSGLRRIMDGYELVDPDKIEYMYPNFRDEIIRI